MCAHKYNRVKKHRPLHRPRSAARLEKFLEGAISSMRYNNGSTSCRSISNLICMDYGWSKREVMKHVHVALKKAVATGLVEFNDGRYKLGNIRRYLKKRQSKNKKRTMENIAQMDHNEIL
ncbi:hypothetical protein CBL_03650 [Carabus blaptoides fortunei]